MHAPGVTCLLTDLASSPTGPASSFSSSSSSGPDPLTSPVPSPTGPASGLCTSVNLFPALSVASSADSSCERSIYK